MEAEVFEVQGDSPLTPVPRPNREDLRNIPAGAAMLVVNLTEEGVEFVGHTWTEAMRETWIDQLVDEEDSFMSTSIFYVHPSKLAVDNLPVKSEDEVIAEIKTGWSPAADDMDDFIRDIIRRAREGMTVNPF